MKASILALGLLALASPAKAQTQVYTAVSSATWCYISVSTSVPTRVDNFAGSCEGLLSGRTALRIINGAGTLHGGFDTTLSTKTTSGKYGDIWNPNDVKEMNLGSDLTYYLMSEAAASPPKVIVQQARQLKKLYPRE